MLIAIMFILFNLVNEKTGQDCSMIEVAQQSTFVTKTKKKNGFHIYWLSLKQNEAIISEDCKKGFEFEIKTDKKRWHCTLPPSVHRDDANFCYKNYRQDKLIVSDKLYDKIMKLLAECLKTEGEADNENILVLLGSRGLGIVLHRLNFDEEIHAICGSISPYYKKEYRHNLVYALCGIYS
jgi:hypothetical protein